MNRTIVIVEGPSGGGKTTYINKMVDQGSMVGAADVVNATFSKDRLPQDVFHSGLIALRNDTHKLFTAVSMFLEQPELQVVFIDRLIISQMVYHEIRTGCLGYNKKNIRFSMSEVRSRLNGICYYVNTMLPAYISFTSPDYVAYPELSIAIDIKFIVPEWEELQRRRATSTKEYPAGRTDHQLYTFLYQRAGTDYIERAGQLVL